jgi:Fic family protein
MFLYQFVRIHPFDDGNGRMSRLLMNLILMQHGFPPVIIQTETRTSYFEALQYADHDDFDMFIIFIGEKLIESLDLWLRAAKGEPFEEEEDIDTQVMNIKKKIENGEK